MHIQSLAGEWQFRQAHTEEWLPARVPGGVHTDLLAAGRIPDPFVADNEKHVQWVAESDWEYRRTFSADAAVLAQERVFLVCDGLDTLAEVTLNGRLLGKTDNMFRQYRWDVKSLLRPGESELVIAFASPVKYTAARQAERPLRGVTQAIPGGPHLRKAPCQFGWDWGPQLPPIGIWKDIRLEGRSVARLDDVHLRQRHENGQVTLEVTLTVERWSQTPLMALMRVTAPDGTVWEKTSEVLQTSVVSVTIPNPQLWWPNGYPSASLTCACATLARRPGRAGAGRPGGAQPLYQVEVALLTGGEGQLPSPEIGRAPSATLQGGFARAGGEGLDQRTYRVGLRTLELRQEPDEWGKSFTFVVNGVPIFAKGSNWIPADSFPTRISDEYLDALIGGAAATHQNMLRVWGGGFYEEERFYDLCDRYGILVWQDMIFSCSIYPLDDDAFLENVRVEITEAVRRLRHRASLALWCGNNEMEWGWEIWGWAKSEFEEETISLAAKIPALKGLLRALGQRQLLPDWKELRDAYDKFFHATLPEWVAQHDPDRPYWPSSPSSNTPFHNVNGQEQGDAHYWDVWHGRQPFTAYRDQYPRFMSEFGFQSLPPLETIRSYADEANWNITSYIMEHHQRSASGNGLMIGQMTDTFRMPKDFPSLVYLSMVLQAEGIRYGVEHWRRSMQRVSGTLYWQTNDCWPVASWSSLDYFGRWKALHYAARHFYAPVLLSIEDDKTKMGLHVTSDLTEPWEGSLRWSLETLDGKTLAAGEKGVSAAPLASTPVCILDFADQVSDSNCREVIFVCELHQGDRRLALNVATFVPSKHLALTDPALTVDVRPAPAGLRLDGDQLAFEMTARSLARFVELALTGADVVFSDNYFDLPAGRTATVTCPLPAGWTLERARQALRMRSLYDSFA